jgi:acyl-CoA synthetase (AMP-forming)/AMP-acid ligase II
MSEDIIFKSKFPSIDIVESNLPEYVLRQIGTYGSKKALIDGITGESLTFDDITSSVRKVARGLLDVGFKKGEVFCIFCPNIIYYPVIFHGVLLAGGVVTTANPLYTAEELEHQLTDSGAKYMITIPLFVDKAREAMKNAKLDEKNLYVFGDVAGTKSFLSLVLNDGQVPALDVNIKKDIAVLPYSSGTTGMPKGVCLSHYNLVANLQQFRPLESTHFKPDEVLVGVLPFFHIYGMVAVLNLGLISGVTTVVVPRFDMEKFLQLVQQYKISWAHLVPPIVLGLAKHPIVANYDISSLRSIVSAAAPLGKQLQEELCQKLKVNIRQGYGMTELSPVTHIVPIDAMRLGSVGLLVPNCEVKIIDVDTNQSVGVGKAGEICIRGPNVMLGYLNNQIATEDTIDKDGFIHTGDIGMVDEDGYYYIVDRLKELIKYNGYQVPPAELEALLITHEAIADAAVIGVPDEEAGELPKGYVVLKPGKTVAPEELSTWLEQHVAPYKKLRGGIEFVESIPKSASGKILRRLLKEKLLKK